MQFAEALASGEFDIVVVESDLGWTRGPAVVETVKRTLEVPVILFTEPGNDQTVADAVSAGVDEFVVKGTEGFLRLPEAVKELADKPKAEPAVEAHLADLIARSGLGTFRATIDGGLLEANGAFLDLLQMGSIQAALSANVHELCLPGERRSQLLMRLRRDGFIHEEELRLMRADGEWVTVALTETVSTQDGEQVVNGLIEAVPEQQAPDALANKAVIAAHDLKEPLRTMLRYSEMLKSRYRGQLDAEGHEFLDFVHDAAARMRKQVETLFSTGETVTAPPDAAESTEADVAFNDAIERLDALLGDAGASITCDPLPRVMVPHSELLQLLQNLLENAIKFRGDNIAQVHVTAERRGAQWLFSVEDNGIGIPSEDAERIFGMFQRAQHPYGNYPGTGIGLAVCKGVVERYGGRIWVESGKGSIFYFTLPADDTAPLRAVTPAPAKKPAARTASATRKTKKKTKKTAPLRVTRRDGGDVLAATADEGETTRTPTIQTVSPGVTSKAKG